VNDLVAHRRLRHFGLISTPSNAIWNDDSEGREVAEREEKLQDGKDMEKCELITQFSYSYGT
jgi:hypothetical protein